MTAPPYPPAHRAADLAAATWLQLGLEALQRGDTAAAIGALACISEEAWDVFLRRFPSLPDLITKWSNPR